MTAPTCTCILCRLLDLFDLFVYTVTLLQPSDFNLILNLVIKCIIEIIPHQGSLLSFPWHLLYVLHFKSIQLASVNLYSDLLTRAPHVNLSEECPYILRSLSSTRKISRIFLGSNTTKLFVPLSFNDCVVIVGQCVL